MSALVKFVIVVFLFFVLISLFFDVFMGVDESVASYTRQFRANGATAIVVPTLLVFNQFLPIPSGIVIAKSGSLFGGLLGGAIALIGTLLGALITFFVSRTLGQGQIKKKIGETYEKASEQFLRYGAYTVILSRMIPFVSETVSSIAGVSKMTLKEFLLLHVVGSFPLIFLYSYIGSYYGNQSVNLFFIAVVGFLIPPLVWYAIVKAENYMHAIDRLKRSTLFSFFRTSSSFRSVN